MDGGKYASQERVRMTGVDNLGNEVKNERVVVSGEILFCIDILNFLILDL